MANVPEGAQLSEDGQWWWDGENWQAVEGQTAGGHGGYSDPNQPMDWNQFPELARMIHYGGDIDAYLTDIGVDPNIMCDDEPFANA